ncbi:MAG: patatin-like phospholipase family protein [Pseudomonadota bacterium]
MATLQGSRGYIALEGGGAKGVLHVGALGAIREQGIEVRGVAGTSAGAIVASLFAVGYEPHEIVDVDSDHTILRYSDGHETALDLIEPRDWARLRFLRGLGSRVRQVYLLSLLLALLGAPLVVSAEFGALWGAAAMAGVAAVLGLGGYALISGLASLRKFRNALGGLLAEKVFPEEGRLGGAAPETVTFSHFGPGTDRPTLKIVATNLSTGELQLFSPELTPAVPVADAVAASGCIPIAFKAWRVTQGLPNKRRDHFVDGGLLSNLPVWAFDDERVLDRDAIGIAVEISDGESQPRRAPKGFFAWVRRFVRTTIFGGQGLTAKTQGRSVSIELDTEIGVLDLDMGAEDVRQTVREARASASAALLLEERLSETPAEIAAIARDLFDLQGLARFAESKIRVSVTPMTRAKADAAIRNGAAEIALQLRHHSGFEDDLDEFLNVPLARSFIGATLRADRRPGEGAFFDVNDPAYEDLHFNAVEDRWTQKHVTSRLQWIFVIPISIAEVAGSAATVLPDDVYIVTVDSDEAEPTDSVEQDRFFETISWIEARVGGMFRRLGESAED